MNEHDNRHAAEPEHAAERYFMETTRSFYIDGWNPDHIHFGLFEDGQWPEEHERLAESPVMAWALERMIEEIVAPAGIREDHHVVDAGSGVGGTAIYLAKTRGCAVTGVNLSRLQLEKARKKAVDAGLSDRVGFEYGDCSRRLPFEDDSVDVVVNIESACHFDDRGRFLREVRRVLKPEGRIVAADWLARDDLTSDQYRKYIKPLLEPWALQPLESRGTYIGRLHDAGLELMQFEGFGGRDAGNLRIIEGRLRNLVRLWFGGLLTDEQSRWMEMLGPLYAAWRDGFFELGRYCAEKRGESRSLPDPA